MVFLEIISLKINDVQLKVHISLTLLNKEVVFFSKTKKDSQSQAHQVFTVQFKIYLKDVFD